MLRFFAKIFTHSVALPILLLLAFGYQQSSAQCSKTGVKFKVVVNTGCIKKNGRPIRLATVPAIDSTDSLAIQWDFGDGKGFVPGGDSVWSPAYQKGTYLVKMRITNNKTGPGQGSICSQDSQNVFINGLGKPNVYSPNLKFCTTPFNITLIDSTSGPIKIRQWLVKNSKGTSPAFSKSKYDSSRNDSFNFNVPNSGSYDVLLQVTDSYGCSTFDTLNKYLYLPVPLTPDICTQLQVGRVHRDSIFAKFSASNLNAGLDLTGASYLWNFGDKSPTDTNKNPSHLYKNVDSSAKTNYSVSLKITLKNGCTDSFTQQNVITRYVSEMDSAPLNVMCIGSTVRVFNNKTAYTGNKGFYSYTTSVSSTRSQKNSNDTINYYTFSTSGLSDLTINFGNIKNANRCQASVLIPAAFNILPPHADFNSPDLSNTTCNKPARVFVQSRNKYAGAKYMWFVYDTSTITPRLVDSITVTTDTTTLKLGALDSGFFTVKLKIIDPNGGKLTCEDSITKNAFISVNSPLPDFSIQDTIVCAGKTLKIKNLTFPSDTTIHPYTYSWTVVRRTNPITTKYNGKKPSVEMDSLGAFDIQLKVQLSKTCVFNSTKHGVYVDGTAASIKSTPINTCIGTGSAKLAVRLSSYNPAVPLFGKFGGFLWSSSDPTDVTFSPSTATTTVDSTDSVVTVKIAAGSTTKSFDASVLIVNSSGCSTIVTKSAFLHLGTKAIIKAPKVGCTGVPVSFTDISQYGPDTFSWSVAPDPTKNVATAKASVDSPNSKNCHITFTDTGFFVITHKIDKGGPLSGLGASGCYKDTTDTIHIQHPRAYFSSPNQQSGCAPQIVSFDSIAPTKNIAMYYWNYGDKTSDSTLDTNWFHIYALNNPNGFTVSMAVKDSQGCIDTFKRLSFIHLNGPVPGFTISAHSACGDSTMTITNTSINITDLTLDFRDGSAAQTGNFTTITHKYTYTDYSKDSLKYYPLMIASDNSAATCYATYTDSITLYRPPSARISSSSATTGCAPYTVNFQDVSLYNDSTFNRWDFDGDGIIDASNNHANPSFTYNTPGTYTVRLFVSTGHCTDSVTQVNMITIYGRPTADFTVDNDTACPSNLFTLSATDKNPWNSVITGYNWDFGDTTSSNVGDSVPTHTYKYGGGHDVQLIVTNSDGCSDTTLKTGFIYTYPTVIPDSPLILSVSVDLNAQSSNTGAVIVKWSKDVSGNFSKFDLFRSDMAAPIDPGITDPNIDTFYDQTTDVYDLSYGYALDKSDKCGFTSFKGPAHYTMVLRATPNPIGTVPYIDLTWSNYVGWKDIVSSSGVAGPIAYQVWRKDNNNIYYSLVTTLFATTTTAADTFVRDSNNICNGVYRYYIVAVHPTDSSLNSNSNRDSAAPNYTFQTKQLNLLSTTVINDTMTFTKWTGVMQPNVKAFIIDRQDTSGRWVIGYDSVGPNQDSFYDTKARVNSTSYHYRVKVLDKCGNLTDGTNPNEAGPSNLGTSMYFGAGVVGNCPNEQFSFLWTPYDSFKAGRDRYILQIKDNAGNWRDYKNLDAKIDSAGDDSIHLDINGPACYRIVAYSSSDPDNSYNQNQSISNSKCLLNCSRLYFPDAFTPNGDGLNDSFAVTSVAVFNGIDPRDLQYSFKIFNRWGELVWSTNDLHAKWGGQFGDDKSGKAYQDCPVDVYVYQVEAHGMDKQIFFKKGVVTIIR